MLIIGLFVVYKESMTFKRKCNTKKCTWKRSENCAILSAIVAYHVWISKNILEFIIVCFRIVFGMTNDF